MNIALLIVGGLVMGLIIGAIIAIIVSMIRRRKAQQDEDEQNGN